MKKILLTASLIASSLMSMAQVTIVPIYRGENTNPYDSVNSLTGFSDFGGCPGDFVFTEVTEGSGNVYLKLTGSSAGYYVCGVNNGNYNALGTNVSFGYSGAANGYVAFRIKAGNTNTRVKIGLQTPGGRTFAKETDLSTVTGAAAGFVIFNLPFADLLEENSSGGVIGVAPTMAELAQISQINVILSVQSYCSDPTAVPGCSGTPGTISRSGEFWIDDIFMTETALTSIPPTPVAEINVKKGDASTGTSVADAGTTTLADVLKNTAGTPQIFTIENTGTGILNITGVTVTGADFARSSMTFPIAIPAASSIGFDVTFNAPATAGTSTGTITITSDDADEATYTVDISANSVNATAPEINVKLGATSVASAGTATLPSVVNGSTGTAQTFTIENTGSALLNVTTFTLTGSSDFTLGGSNTTPFTVAAGGSHTFTVTFAPTSTGLITGLLTINSDDADEGAYTVTVSSTGNAVSGTNAAAANISSSKVYPNPVSDMANIELNLKASSDVKVTLSDMMGKTLMTVAEGSMSSLNKEFSVVGLNKGIYTVTYFINGAAAKAELLMVK